MQKGKISSFVRMKVSALALIFMPALLNTFVQAQKSDSMLTRIRRPKIDFHRYEALVHEAKAHRAKRLIDLDTFLKMAKDHNTIVLDTRSDGMFASKHIKGAIHLNFSDFTQANLERIIPSFSTRILIYCNNNFEGDERFFASKIATPKFDLPEINLALNIPTYINLYGYGYRNVYELSELVDIKDGRLIFEGTGLKPQ